MDFMQWLEQSWLYVVAFGVGISAIINLSKNMKAVKDMLTKPEQEQNEKIEQNASFIKLLKEEREEYLANVKRWDSHEHKAEENFSNINNALTSLIRDRINCFYFQKCTDRGFITPIELEIVEQLYSSYSAMGGNGMISREMEIIRKLPVFDNRDDFERWYASKHKKEEA